MKNWIHHAILPLVLATGVCAQSEPPVSLATIAREQKAVETRVAGLTGEYRTVLDEMRKLGTGREDLALVAGALDELASLRQRDMERILGQLQAAARDPHDTASLSAAYTGQKLVVARLRSLAARLESRQQELALARKARELAARQAANQPLTAALKPGTPASSFDRVKVSAEQQALREETLSLAEQVRRLRSDPQTPHSESFDRLSQPEALDALRASAEDAVKRLDVGDFAAATAQEALLFDRLLRLSELGRRTPPPAEAARAAVRQIDTLLAAQKAKPDAAAQAALAAKTEAMRPQVDGQLAAAGSQLRQAAEAMRQNAAKPADTTDAAAEQHLQAARDLLEKQAGQLAAAEAAKPPATPQTEKAEADQLALFARQAQQLQQEEEKLIKNVATGEPAPTPAAVDAGQIDLTRRTAALQRQVQAIGHEAAAPLGQAAVRMAESLSTAQPAPTADLAAAARQTAVERLAQAVALLTEAAKEQEKDAALAAAKDAAQRAADQLAQAADQLGKSAAGKKAPDQAAQDSIATAQQALGQAAQAGAQLPADAKQSMSQSWQQAKQAADAAAKGDAAAAQAAAAQAAQAARQAQAQLAQAQAQGQGQGMAQNQGPEGQQIAPDGSTGGVDTRHDTDALLSGSGNGADVGSALVQEGISRHDRDALAAARRQPVPRAYDGMVESYFENLSATP